MASKLKQHRSIAAKRTQNILHDAPRRKLRRKREYERGSRKVESKRKDLVPGAIAAPFADLNALKAAADSCLDPTNGDPTTSPTQHHLRHHPNSSSTTMTMPEDSRDSSWFSRRL
jgi:hypothetical protein